MTKPVASEYPSAQARERIIVALDVPTAAEALEVVGELNGSAGAFKVGSQLFTAAGPSFVRELAAAGHRVFLDLKFHDIPNTVANAAIEAARLGVWMLNVHALGGGEMMKRTVGAVREVCETENIARPLVVGVTVLTSSGTGTLSDVGIGGSLSEAVVRLAKLASSSGLDGVVASPQEVKAVRGAVSEAGFLLVTPGIRPAGATVDDQRRVTTFAQAIGAGSDFVVIGRPVLAAHDRRAALENIVAELDQK